MTKKVLTAMSGGVDSSVAALLIKRQGYETVGATLKLFSNEEIGLERDRTCCSLSDVEDARSVAIKIGIPHYVFNFSESFKAEVIGRFTAAYISGATPNPCIDCNRYIKFGKLYGRAALLGFDYIATGHYADIEFNAESGRYLLKKAADPEKDQSYVLYGLAQGQLAATLFPLGGLKKSEVRKIAEENGFLNARKRDSQDICFIREGGYVDFIERQTGRRFEPGAFVSKDGRTVGSHRGYIRYTIGQRKGLGISSERPLYVCGIDPAENIITLGCEEELYSKSLTVKNINLISCETISSPVKLKAKIRYRQKEQDAVAVQTGPDELRIEFNEPQRAITKGQSAVLYDGEYVVGGGIIT